MVPGRRGGAVVLARLDALPAVRRVPQVSQRFLGIRLGGERRWREPRSSNAAAEDWRPKPHIRAVVHRLEVQSAPRAERRRDGVFVLGWRRIGSDLILGWIARVVGVGWNGGHRHGLSQRGGLRRGYHGGYRRDLIAARRGFGDLEDLPAQRADVLARVVVVTGHPSSEVVGFGRGRYVVVDGFRAALGPVALAGDLLGAVGIGGDRDGPDALRLRGHLAVRDRHSDNP